MYLENRSSSACWHIDAYRSWCCSHRADEALGVFFQRCGSDPDVRRCFHRLLVWAAQVILQPGWQLFFKSRRGVEQHAQKELPVLLGSWDQLVLSWKFHEPKHFSIPCCPSVLKPQIIYNTFITHLLHEI